MQSTGAHDPQPTAVTTRSDSVCGDENQATQRPAPEIWTPTVYTPTALADNRTIFTHHLQGLLRLLIAQSTTAEAQDPLWQERLLSVLALVFTGADAEVWRTANRLLIRLGPQLEEMGQYLLWTEPFRRAVVCATVIGDWGQWAQLALQLGNLLRLQGAWDPAADLYQQVVARIEASTQTEQISAHVQAEALNRLAFLARLRGELTLAEEYVARALASATWTGNEQPTADAAVVENSYFVLGTIAYDRRALETAESYLRQSLALCETLRAPHKLAQRTRDVGLVLADQGKLDQAQTLLAASIEHFGALQKPVAQAIARMNLGIVYSRQGDPMRALDCYAAAQPVFAQAHDQLNLALLYNNQGVDYRAIGRYAEAVHAFQASVAVRRTIANNRSLANVLDNLGRTYVELGDLPAARATFTEALALLDQVAGDTGVEKLRAGVTAQLRRLEPAPSPVE